MILVLAGICVQEIAGHGMMLEPPNRSSLWRFPQDFPGAIPNYEDNENFCGGMSVSGNLQSQFCSFSFSIMKWRIGQFLILLYLLLKKGLFLKKLEI